MDQILGLNELCEIDFCVLHDAFWWFQTLCECRAHTPGHLFLIVDRVGWFLIVYEVLSIAWSVLHTRTASKL